jgi:hypothetical protein
LWEPGFDDAPGASAQAAGADGSADYAAIPVICWMGRILSETARRTKQTPVRIFDVEAPCVSHA